MVKRLGKKTIAIISVAVLILVGTGIYLCVPKKVVEPVALLTQSVQNDGEMDYAAFLELKGDVPQADKAIRVAPEGESVKISAGSEYSLSVNAPKRALYSVSAVYKTDGETLIDYDMSLFVNGSLQYAELSDVPLKTEWVIDKKTYREGFSPDLIQSSEAVTQPLRDRNAYYAEPLQICLEQGDNTLTVKAGTMDLTLCALLLEPLNEIPTYAEYKKGLSGNKGEKIYFQGEYADSRNNPSILELSDGTSAKTVPASADKTTVNTIGGSSFSTPMDSLSWTFNVEKAGTYTLNMRIRQDFSSGAAVCRTLLIDGKVPFSECQNIVVPYDNGFRQYVPGENGEAYCFELEAGEHTLTLEVTLGQNAAVVKEMNKVLDSLNTMYRRIIMLTSPNPDPYRDYRIAEKLPDVLEEMKLQAKHLKNISDYIAYTGGGRGNDTSIIDKMYRQLLDFIDDPEGIPSLLGSFNSNKSAIGTWIIEKKNQPLEIDWIEFVPAKESGTDGKETLLQSVGFAVKQFLASYNDDYKIIEKENEVEVWTAAGRDQVEVLTRLINEQFTAKTDIPVKLKLVQGGTILPAVVSGLGPDVSLMNSNGEAINFAARKAAAELSRFDGYKDIAAQFHDSALVPLRLEGKTYGLPETQTFPVLFYRTDIFEEMGYSVPKTWDEAYNLMFDLQKNNMEFGIPTGIFGYSLFLYQNNGQLYNNDGSRCTIDNENGIKAFAQWTKYFSDFGMPMTYNFVNRFRSGEMPIGISDYTAYNTLVVFAPEIYDNWDIACVPGTVQEDGSINRSVASTGTCSIMFESSDNKENAWEFLKWWCGNEAQQSYAREIEIRLGASARYAAANKIAFDNLMWTPKQLSVLKEQKESVKGVPETPGGYFTSRHIENSFRKVVLNSTDVKETLVEYCELINLEIAEKRDELNIGEEE